MGSLAKLVLLILAVMIAGLLVRFAMMGSQSRKATGPERIAESLAPCPERPNCVSSLAPREDQAIEPLPILDSVAETIQNAQRAIETMAGASVVEVSDGYLRAEFRSRLFRFVDDLELLADPETGMLQVRSASRVGYSDLGANRKRVETLRDLLTTK